MLSIVRPQRFESLLSEEICVVRDERNYFYEQNV
jgi:hypothetical protein